MTFTPDTAGMHDKMRIRKPCVFGPNTILAHENGGHDLWSYYSPKNVSVVGPTAMYQWGDKTLSLHHCGTCGCVTHWSPLDPDLDRMGVNARLMAPEVVAAARVRRFDGADTWKFLD